MRHSQGQQHVAGIQAAAGAGAAGAGADAGHVQAQQQALPLDALKAEADDAGDLVVRVTVAAGAGNPAQALDELVPHGRHLFGVLLQVLAALLQRRRHGQDAGDGLGAAPEPPLLGAALDKVLQLDPPAAVHGPHALGGVELVAGEGEHVDVVPDHIHADVAHRLDGVGVEEDAALPAQRADLPDGLEGADLIVGVHDGHQAGVGADGRRQLLQADQAVLMDGEVSDLEPLLLQLGQGVEHRVVLDGVGDDVAFPGGRPQAGPLGDGPVVRLGAAAGEVDLPGLGVQALGNRLPGGDEGQIGLPALLVKAAGVAVELAQSGQHGVQGRLAHGSGGRVVCINKHVSLLLSGKAGAGRRRAGLISYIHLGFTNTILRMIGNVKACFNNFPSAGWSIWRRSAAACPPGPPASRGPPHC